MRRRVLPSSGHESQSTHGDSPYFARLRSFSAWLLRIISFAARAALAALVQFLRALPNRRRACGGSSPDAAVGGVGGATGEADAGTVAIIVFGPVRVDCTVRGESGMGGLARLGLEW